ncbi:MAG: flagellar type III secretion system pore protein FliP [Ilumatobacter sp.]|uniref:flagellar type III secretion system pore protein FliP n=1 Tax=Ilumatobacter sp. TaxID=1967498 RepID=UPI002602723D|nr:flagellar type III secretion system pore protein FliP [Ilumatobacter sp.]MDJ0767439.1 flagellar type III secretion system pore protein FliP [Ilumatobacter sp.]
MPDTSPDAGSARPTAQRKRWRWLGVGVIIAIGVMVPTQASAAPTPPPAEPLPTIPEIPDIEPIDVPEVDPTTPPARPADPIVTDDSGGSSATIGLEVPDVEGNPSNAVVIILLLSVLSIAPSLLVLMTSFTRIVIVMSLTRNALGIPQLPPQQVIVGLSLFLTIFVMGPTLSEMNDVALQPLMADEIGVSDALDRASGPLREFMLDYTREPELELFLDASGTETPITRDEVPLSALVPAFVLSELKSAFILGFIIFVPFLVIDLVVSAVLTSLGMMMLPPTFVSLPLKLLLFVLLDGWMLVTGTLLESYR